MTRTSVHGRRSPGGMATAIVATTLVLTGCGDRDADEAISSAADAIDQSGDDVAESSETVASALEAEGLTTLASAVRDIDIAEVAGGDEFTLFAPNDEAFLTLTADELANLNDDADLMAATLQAHIVEGVVEASELSAGDQLTTLAGTTLEVDEEDGGMTVGGATVVATDVRVGDGIVHTVDQLLASE